MGSLIPQTLGRHGDGHQRHLVRGVHLPEVVTPRELVDVALQDLVREFVIGPVVGRPHHRPERLDAVGVGHAAR